VNSIYTKLANATIDTFEFQWRLVPKQLSILDCLLGLATWVPSSSEFACPWWCHSQNDYNSVM